MQVLKRRDVDGISTDCATTIVSVKSQKSVSFSVGNSSARAKKRTCFVIARFGVSDFESSSHNPEVVGSNPAPATRQKTQKLRFLSLFCLFFRLRSIRNDWDLDGTRPFFLVSISPARNTVAPTSRQRAVGEDISVGLRSSNCSAMFI